MSLTDGRYLSFNRGPKITTIYGDQFTTSDHQFESLKLGQPAFFDEHLLVIIDIDKKKRILTASESMETVIKYFQN